VPGCKKKKPTRRSRFLNKKKGGTRKGRVSGEEEKTAGDSNSMIFKGGEGGKKVEKSVSIERQQRGPKTRTSCAEERHTGNKTEKRERIKKKKRRMKRGERMGGGGAKVRN